MRLTSATPSSVMGYGWLPFIPPKTTGTSKWHLEMDDGASVDHGQPSGNSRKLDTRGLPSVAWNYSTNPVETGGKYFYLE